MTTGVYAFLAIRVLIGLSLTIFYPLFIGFTPTIYREKLVKLNIVHTVLVIVAAIFHSLIPTLPELALLLGFFMPDRTYFLRSLDYRSFTSSFQPILAALTLGWFLVQFAAAAIVILTRNLLFKSPPLWFLFPARSVKQQKYYVVLPNGKIAEFSTEEAARKFQEELWTTTNSSANMGGQ